MGCMGMTMDDVMHCTPSEFREIYNAWSKLQEDNYHADWERTRMICLCSLLPHSKKKIKATDVMKFPWDKQEKKKKPRKLTAKEKAAAQAHYEAEKKARGII